MMEYDDPNPTYRSIFHDYIRQILIFKGWKSAFLFSIVGFVNGVYLITDPNARYLVYRIPEAAVNILIGIIWLGICCYRVYGEVNEE